MKITIDITSQQIADLMITAIESGDPVTTASRGGWCAGIYWESREDVPPESNEDGPWYAQQETWKGDFVVEVIEVDDEVTGHETSHKIGQKEMAAGLTVMATKHPNVFKDILEDNVNASTADMFLQCVCFGEERYA